MKKNITAIIAATMLISSCTSSQYHTGNGAVTGAYLGSILGSAIGGISGGYRGSDIGTIVGMAGGALAGAAIGSAADKADQREYEDHKRRTLDRRDAERSRNYGDSNSSNNDVYVGASGNEVYVDPSNSGDDRIVFEDEAPANDNTGTIHIPANRDRKVDISNHHNIERNSIEIRNISITDQNGDGMLGRKEVCRVSFEIMNRGRHTIHNITPEIVETSGNSHIFISQGITVESIGAGNGVRYTASVAADNKIKNGAIVLKLSAKNNGETLVERTLRVNTTQTKFRAN